jgi:tRNA threonylcarbamoyladenosine biosynthesis protein TsaE
MSLTFTYLSNSANDTKRVGSRVGRMLQPGDAVLFLADLGAGKTTFVQGLVKSLGVHESALSPTFVIAQTLKGKVPVHHLDFYRLSPKEILDMGAQDYLNGGGAIERGVVLIEWAERCSQIWPKERLEVRIRIKPDSEVRAITLTSKGKRYDRIVRFFK